MLLDFELILRLLQRITPMTAIAKSRVNGSDIARYVLHTSRDRRPIVKQANYF